MNRFLMVVSLFFFSSSAFAQSQENVLSSTQEHVLTRVEHLGLNANLSLSQSMAIEARDGDVSTATLGLGYRFNHEYSVGLQESYRWPFQQDISGYNGAGDLMLSMTNHALYESPESAFRLEGKLSYIIPQSDRSYRSSMKSGIEGDLKAFFGFNHLFKVELETSVGNFDYDYDTKESISNRQIFNSPFVWGTSAGVFIKLHDQVRWGFVASTKLAFNYDSSEISSAAFSTGPSWEATPNLVADAAIRTSNRPGGLDSTGDPTDSSRSSNFFDASTTALMVGARLKL
jgi:hypothetical protein